MKRLCTIEGCEDLAKSKGMCQKHYQKKWHENNKKLCPGSDCKARIVPWAAFCGPCSGKARRGKNCPAYKNGRNYTDSGYVFLTGQHDHPNSNKRGLVLEHVKVMTEYLGRPLVHGENVHHKNGIRDDNRIENLELWYARQPKGQRVEEMIEYLRSVGYTVEKSEECYDP